MGRVDKYDGWMDEFGGCSANDSDRSKLEEIDLYSLSKEI